MFNHENGPTKKLKQLWAEQLCRQLQERGLKATWCWESDLDTVKVRYRIEDATWNYWSRLEEAWGSKPKRKIQTLWLLSSSRYERRQGVMIPIQKWECEETEQVFQEEVLSYATGRSIKI